MLLKPYLGRIPLDSNGEKSITSRSCLSIFLISENMKLIFGLTHGYSASRVAARGRQGQCPIVTAW